MHSKFDTIIATLQLREDKMKENFEKAFVDYRKDMMPEVSDMVKSEW